MAFTLQPGSQGWSPWSLPSQRPLSALIFSAPSRPDSISPGTQDLRGAELEGTESSPAYLTRGRGGRPISQEEEVAPLSSKKAH